MHTVTMDPDARTQLEALARSTKDKKTAKHTLRRGNAPQVMSWHRSMCISLCNTLKLRSISDTIHNLEKSPRLLEQFLRMAAVM